MNLRFRSEKTSSMISAVKTIVETNDAGGGGWLAHYYY